jgi:heparin binding hemagglutinin HbhA
MAVDLPTTAEVRKARHDAAKTAAQRAEAARTPLLAVLGAGELAVSAVSKVVAELPQHLNADELRKAVVELREQAGHAYAGFAEQGEETWGRIRTQPQVKDALQRIGSSTPGSTTSSTTRGTPPRRLSPPSARRPAPPVSGSPGSRSASPGAPPRR